MEMLVIGLDGGDRRILNAMDVPRLRGMFDQGRSVTLTEDLWTRGWAETLTGASGPEMNGFYIKPKCDGTRDFIETFEGDDYLNPTFKPLWTRLNEKGKKIGFMNIPTTAPVPKVQGFIVGGEGSGCGVTVTMAPQLCWPRELASKLEKLEYIFDTRLGQVDVNNHDDFFDRLKFIIEKRTEIYIQLCKDYGIDYGYLAYMGISRSQFLAMSELESLLENDELAAVESSRQAQLSPVQKMMMDLFTFQDTQIGRLIDELKPAHWMLVADHGAVSIRYKTNLNAFLRRAGFQSPTTDAGIKTATKKTTRLNISTIMPKTVIKKAIEPVHAIGNDTDWHKTLAFSHRCYGGIYIHDNERFGGPVQSQAEVERLTDEIVAAFNDDPEAQKHQMTARPYRRQHPDTPKQEILPDVWVEAPDGYFFESFGKFIKRNLNLGPIDSILEATNDTCTGMKGKHPLFCVSLSLAQYIHDDDPDDLRLAYRVIDRLVSS